MFNCLIWAFHVGIRGKICSPRPCGIFPHSQSPFSRCCRILHHSCGITSTFISNTAVLPWLLRVFRCPYPPAALHGIGPQSEGGRYCNCKQYRLLLANIILQRYYVHQRDGEAYADRVDLSLVSLCPYVCPSY